MDLGKQMNESGPQTILVIRRDNIGDLVCTTPLLSSLRKHFPTAKIDVLVNSYNAPVLLGNPDVNDIYIYKKAKHRSAGESRLSVWWGTLRLMQNLRNQCFDLVIVATPAFQPNALKFAHWINGKRLIAYGTADDGIDDPIPLSRASACHETEAVMALLEPLGIRESPGALTVCAGRTGDMLLGTPPAEKKPLVGLHISARKPSQRWPIERFAELAKRLNQSLDARFRIFWSPGESNNPLHPGDNAKAAELVALCQEIPVQAYATETLPELINGLNECDIVVCSDGGAMHLAAGLGKPIICFFGHSDSARWRPWGIAHELLQAESREASDISVDQTFNAFVHLLETRNDSK